MSDQQQPSTVSISSNGGSRPVPDPTALTDQAIDKAISAERDWAKGQFKVLEERLNGDDKATDLRLRVIDGIPALIVKEVGALEKLVNQQFESAERQRVEQKKDTKDAVDAALSAAKEAVKEQTTASERSIAKSETATAAQLKQQQDTFAQAIDGLRRSLDEMKDRMTEDARNLREAIGTVSTTANGTIQQKMGAKESQTGLYAALGAIAGLILLALAIFAFVRPA